ncbi:dTDP-4-dehydrorhamnose reductase (plasmid) [Streptomyces sp. NBC_00536]|uniref:dTDP-4-dehydrorhamnose reductase n=1 Tax=Streptomyces sp. NBC_00536 TaxID=2975769 RepID=UPI002E803BEE|nr:dTDP-4-dehydrorhamnose reductase [Streptomyces sp. NBC_00536]WUC84242.1 dTDP-4-dehydrorhamnose reductase [Streptomyces sp. NBC_00536]
MSHWLVTGADGLLGRDLRVALEAAGQPAVCLGRAELDVRDRRAVRSAIATHRPVVVVNAAAYTDVDAAETHEAQAQHVNGAAPLHLASACGEFGALLLQVSTDYVFSGEARVPYPEDAPAAPRTAYGRTKLEGERAVLRLLPWTGYVVRTAWLYGEGGEGGDDFVRTMIRLEREREFVDVVEDQRGQPTWTADVADRLVSLGRAARLGAAPGIYHATSAGGCTRLELAREVFRLLGADPQRVRPLVGPAPGARRPAYSVLEHGRWEAAGIEVIRDWREALAAAMPALTGARVLAST